eukprot:scaffold29426_cov84-Isochrysis_galbana.AAC.1
MVERLVAGLETPFRERLGGGRVGSRPYSSPLHPLPASPVPLPDPQRQQSTSCTNPPTAGAQAECVVQASEDRAQLRGYCADAAAQEDPRSIHPPAGDPLYAPPRFTMPPPHTHGSLLP